MPTQHPLFEQGQVALLQILIQPRSRLMRYGRPGSGKSLFAAALPLRPQP